jgi:hypothetical protein
MIYLGGIHDTPDGAQSPSTPSTMPQVGINPQNVRIWGDVRFRAFGSLLPWVNGFLWSSSESSRGV